MTSEDIKRRNEAIEDIRGSEYTGFKAVALWLREIAYQLAVFNEQKAAESKAAETYWLHGMKR